jgi:nicotinamidase-related amidase
MTTPGSLRTAVVVAGQAKSHCLAWTIDDLLDDEDVRERLAERTSLLEDCTSPVFASPTAFRCGSRTRASTR